jgi:CHAD domain-containing protein
MAPDFPDKPLSESAQRRLDRATDQGYRLRAGETAADAVRRIAHGRVDTALEQLRREAKTDVAGAIHDARKDLKKLRSLLRLVRADLGKQRYRAENGRYRAAGRLLSGARDAEVKLATLAALAERYPDELPDSDELRRTLEDERDRVAGTAGGPELEQRLEQAATAIATGGAEIDGWDLDDDGFDLLHAGLERSYRRGRDAFRSLGDDPSDIAIHEWRKRVKDLWYQLRLLCSIWPATMKGAADTAHELADLLGDHHDLGVLTDDVGTRTPGALGAPDAERLIALARRRQRELLDAARPLGERLYAEKPKRFTARIAAYWDAARPAG